MGRRIGAGLIVLLLVASGGAYLYLCSSLPQTSGRLSVTGLKAPVHIERDADGVPTIIADSEADAAFGLGFVHAQDRLFQMDLTRRYAAGRLAEIFGPAALPADKQMRLLGLYRLAEQEIPFLSAEVNRVLSAYAAGVNAFLATRRGALPPEFLLLRYSPESWRVADSLAWGKLMALRISGNYRGEIQRADMARTIAPDDLAFLYPGYPKNGPITLAAMRPIYDRLGLDDLLRAMPPVIGPRYASNNWVVDGRHSASGKPLLANDPHLDFGAPGQWYLARLKTPSGVVAGATAAGVPFIVIGHNDHIAWGFTTTAADVEDLFIEKIDPNDPSRYLTPDGIAPFVTRRESILVRGAAPVDLMVRTTRHGPVLSDVLLAGTADPGYVLALSATFLLPRDRSAQALWEASHAANWSGFREALRNFAGPVQNTVYGDDGGTIGFIAPGLVPIRKKGDGWMPVPGWTGEYDWNGFIPFDKLPSAVDPSSGRFVSANNKIVPDSYPYFISRDWDLPDRAERINTLLDAAPVQTPSSSAAIQADTLSLMATRLVPLMTRIAPADPAAGWALEMLRQWDFRMDRDKTAPLLFTAWLRHFSHAVLFGRFGNAVAGYWDLRPTVMEAVLTSHREWCDNPKRPGIETCSSRLIQSLAATIAELRQAYGADMNGWTWGRAHTAVFANPVFSRIPVLRDWWGLSISTGGASDTVDHAPSVIRDNREPFEQRFGAALRIITDLAAPKDSRMIVPPGQSGNPLSDHFADLLQRWRDFGLLVPGRAAAVSTLDLVPANE
ncbi:MAG: penicillin acylase family protein [Alphaproteobacteria bacterium]|nr:penicillin acylase family protein [Alphaproteobacteria bacterium]